MASVDESVSKLANSKIFTKLDVKSGYWRIPLSEDSRKFTTFVTPFRRYQFNRLPFGINSASEIFQRTVSQILGDLEGVICHMDDILIHAADQDTHNHCVKLVLQRLQDAGVTLNEKCQFSKSRVKFLGHIIDSEGVHADPMKVEAIQQFPRPTTVTELQRFLGMTSQLAKFVPSLATMTAPFRSLLGKNSSWLWGEPQETAFNQIKQLLTSTEILAHYDPAKDTIIAADASHDGIGAVLQKQGDGSWRPVCFISRSLSDAEKHYAVIEKEALAVTWASERLEEYFLGTHYTTETDHKPLVPLLNTMDIAKMPPRIQRFHLRLWNMSRVKLKLLQMHCLEHLFRNQIKQPSIFWQTFQYMQRNALKHSRHQAGKFKKLKRFSILIQKQQKSYRSTIDEAILGKLPSPHSHRRLVTIWWQNRHSLCFTLGHSSTTTRGTPRNHQNKSPHIDLCLVAIHLQPDWDNGEQVCHLCNPQTRLQGAFASIQFSWQAVVSSCYGSLWAERENLPDHRWLLFTMDWIATVGETEQQNHHHADQSVFATHGIPDMIISDNGP